jgi:DMSO/TMAO reductase YedYZ molybdopterin-dependent catalytic subunit
MSAVLLKDDLVRSLDPLNMETSVPGLVGGTVMPTEHFYVRNHFEMPRLDPRTWRLNVSGLVSRPLRLSLSDLGQMPSESKVVTLECAGNGRSFLSPQVDGEQWQLGAVSTAEWTGVSLLEVLHLSLPLVGRAGEGVNLLFRGADFGRVNGHATPIHFDRSLTLDEVRDSVALLAYAMNGEPLPMRHGAPLRLIVPGWYGVASVKWLTDIEVVDGPFTGYFQTEKYVYEWERGARRITEPVSKMRVRSLIIEPQSDQLVAPGLLAIRGLAWSGEAPIARVDVSLGDNPWQPARLLGDSSRHCWQRWELITRINRPGPTMIRARATDQAGRAQPEEPEWNRLGYGSNAVQQVGIRCTQGGVPW